MSRTTRQIENAFTYHPPFGNQAERYTALRDSAKQLALQMDEMAPDSREKLVALTHLEDAIMWINAAIGRNEKPQEEATSSFDSPEEIRQRQGL